MTGLVFVTQLVDPEDPVLGFVVGQIGALADRFDRLLVVANEVRSTAVDPRAEVVSLGKEVGAQRARRGLRFEATMAVAARKPGTAVLAHMCPVYLALAAPWTTLHRRPAFLWFVHPHDSWRLRIAERAATKVLTAFPNSYPRVTAKVVPIGHSIDTSLFAPTPPPVADGPFRLLALGRMSAVKGYATTIDAVDHLRRSGVDVTLRIVGPATTAAEVAHRDELRGLIDSRALVGAVTLHDGVTRAELPKLIAECTALVNNTRAVSADKVVFEAMSAGRPSIVASPAFTPLFADLPLRLTFAADDAGDLADVIAGLVALPRPALQALCVEVSRRVADHHSLEHWADEVVRVVEGPPR